MWFRDATNPLRSVSPPKPDNLLRTLSLLGPNCKRQCSCTLYSCAACRLVTTLSNLREEFDDTAVRRKRALIVINFQSRCGQFARLKRRWKRVLRRQIRRINHSWNAANVNWKVLNYTSRRSDVSFFFALRFTRWHIELQSCFRFAVAWRICGKSRTLC